MGSIRLTADQAEARRKTRETAAYNRYARAAAKADTPDAKRKAATQRRVMDFATGAFLVATFINAIYLMR